MIVNANDVSNPATLVPFVVKIREKSSRLRFPLVVPAPAAALGIDDGGRSRKSHNEMPLPPLSLSLCLCVLKLAIFPSLSLGGGFDSRIFSLSIWDSEPTTRTTQLKMKRSPTAKEMDEIREERERNQIKSEKHGKHGRCDETLLPSSRIAFTFSSGSDTEKDFSWRDTVFVSLLSYTVCTHTHTLLFIWCCLPVSCWAHGARPAFECKFFVRPPKQEMAVVPFFFFQGGGSPRSDISSSLSSRCDVLFSSHFEHGPKCWCLLFLLGTDGDYRFLVTHNTFHLVVSLTSL